MITPSESGCKAGKASQTMKPQRRAGAERHDDAAVRGAEAVGEMALDWQREPRSALAQLVGLDPQVLQERDLLLVFAGELEVHTIVAPPSTAIACPVM